MEQETQTIEKIEVATTASEAPKKKRGRPFGSKNKPKAMQPIQQG